MGKSLRSRSVNGGRDRNPKNTEKKPKPWSSEETTLEKERHFGAKKTATELSCKGRTV